MTTRPRRWWLACTLMLSGCRAVAPVPERAPASEPVAVASLERASTPEPPRAHVAAPYQPAAERNDASGSACEWSCADVHDCTLVTGGYTPAAAASIELGCLRACVATPERVTLFGCGRPSTIEPGPCGPFLDCVAASWPDARPQAPAPVVDPATDGCRLACVAFGRCFDAYTEPGDMDQCAELCRQSQNADGQRHLAGCARLPSCSEILECVSSTPGA